VIRQWLIDFADWEKDASKEPTRYIAWFEWAAWMHRSGQRQKKCSYCGKWQFPAQLKACCENKK